MSNSDITSPIPLPEIPVKLRCTICSDLARGAVKLPCCEQSICGSCREKLPGVCPVCDHSPLTPDICKDNTALRTTVAVFLRTAEKKHLLSLQKDKKEPPKAATPTLEIQQPSLEPQAPLQSPLQTTQPQANTLEVAQKGVDANPDEAKIEEPNGSGQAVLKPELTEATAQPENAEIQEGLPISGVQPPVEMVTGQNGQWFPNQAQMYAMNYGGQGWDYNQMASNGWGGYGNNMMGYDNMMTYGMGYGGVGNMGNGMQVGGMDWGGARGAWNGEDNMNYNGDGSGGGGYYSASSTSGGYSHQQFHENQFTAQQYHNHFQDGRSRQPFPPGGNNRSFGSAGVGIGVGNGGGAAGGVGDALGIVDGGNQFNRDPQSQLQISQNTPVSPNQEQSKGVPVTDGSLEPQTNGHPVPVTASDADVATADTVVLLVAGTNPEAGGEPNDENSSVPPELTDNIVPHGTNTPMLGPGNEFYHQQQAYIANYPMGQYPGMNQAMSPGIMSPGMNNYGGYRGGFNQQFRGGRGGQWGGFHGVTPPVVEKPPGQGLGVEGAPTGPKALREGFRGGRGGGRGAYAARGSIRGSVNAGSVVSRSESPDHATNSATAAYSPDQERSKRSRRSPPPSGNAHDRETEKEHKRGRERDRKQHSRSPSLKTGSRRQHSSGVGSDGGRSRGHSPKQEGGEGKDAGPEEDASTTEVGASSSLTEGGVIISTSAIRAAKRGREGKSRSRSPRSRSRSPSISRSQSRSPDRRRNSRKHNKRRSRSRHHRKSHRHRDRGRERERERDRDGDRSSHRKRRRSADRDRSKSRSRSPTPTTALSTSAAAIQPGNTGSTAAATNSASGYLNSAVKTDDKDREKVSRREEKGEDKKTSHKRRRDEREDKERERDSRHRGERDSHREKERSRSREKGKDRGGEKEREREKDRDRKPHKRSRRSSRSRSRRRGGGNPGGAGGAGEVEESSHRSSRHKHHDRHDRYDKDKDDRKESSAGNDKEKEKENAKEKASDDKKKDSRSRRTSYRYEEEGLERKAEREREAERWGKR
ncbi:hypothetical protein DFH27DRAFT_363111 [Peziza echinospora]|nr:hypothetical protein DFH27DRAFT_363111 [Peziza echinospora]